MKSTIKFTLLVFFIFSIFFISLFAEWEVGIEGDLMFIANGDMKNISLLAIAVNTTIADDYLSVYDKYSIAAVMFYSDKIKIKNDYTLRIKKKSNNYITYYISSKYVVGTNDLVYIAIGDTQNGVMANNLIRILLDSVSVELYDDDDILLGNYNLKGLQEALKENLGDTEWYNKEIKN
ncbi:hypothetical protein R4L22_11365 [Brachyspira pilosicoli]|uniref:hypothetical protein n=1 Tax=Brachyspira pilosicoli TaxID=52584 RepID=UPI0018DF9960|nr:hypothetical protein [Brachyspira pilosicoli]